MASNRNLIPGDLLAIAIITLIGFATHGEAGLPFLPRMAAVFFPLAVTWFILATALRLFQQEVVSDPRQLWRPALTMIFAASLAAILRGLILNAPVIPIFGLVLSATSAFGMLVWRVIYLILNRKAG
jgi:hypothetical protein